ncbi:MAG: tetratricopeptide repeat protein, partial [Acidobacteria bacterium]|nr:tetratricopeptide repeat protein [Acidobacteriota bacterium]
GLARVYSESNDFENALKAVREARRIKPAIPEISAIEGRVHKEVGDENKAIAAFKRAITEGRGFQPEALTGLGLLYRDRAENAGSSGDLAGEETNSREAAKHFASALKQLAGAPDAAVVYQLLGLLYEKQKRYQDAINIYEDYLRLFPDTVEATAVQSFIIQLKKQMAEKP